MSDPGNREIARDIILAMVDTCKYEATAEDWAKSYIIIKRALDKADLEDEKTDDLLD